MFAKYNTESHPKIEVTFGKTIQDDEDYKEFVRGWLSMYHKEKPFYFLMDTSNTGLVPVKYCFEMGRFIDYLKKNKKPYLKYSIILVKNQFVLTLLKLIFKISKPVAPVYIVKNYDDFIKLDNQLKSNKNIDHINYSYVKSYLEK